MIKSTLKAIALAFVACTAFMSLNSCSSDSSDPTPSSDKEPTKLTVELNYYVNSKVFQYFKVEAIDPDGNAVELTNDNTTELATLPASTMIADQVNSYLSSYNEKLRVYTLPKVTVSSFPKTAKFAIRTTAKDVTMPESEKMAVIAVPLPTFTNDGKGNKQWHDCSMQISFAKSEFTGAGWPNYVSKRNIGLFTSEYTLNSAASYSVSGITQKYTAKSN